MTEMGVASLATTAEGNNTATTAPSGLLRRGWAGRSALRQLVPFGALILIIVVFTLAAPGRFATAKNAEYVLVQSAALAVVAFGSTLVIISGSIDLSVGSLVALSGMIGAGVAVHYGAVAGIVAALLTGAVAGAVNGAGMSFLKVPSFIMTLGMLSVARGATLLYSHTQPITVPDGWTSLGVQPGIYLVAIAVFVACGVLYRFTSFGRYVAAIGGQERVALMSGVPVRRVKTLVFVLSGVAAAVGGVVLSSRVGAATPTAATGMELTVIAAVVLGGTPLTGGVGSLVNTVIGALVINILLNGLVILGVKAEMQMIIQGTVLVAAVLVSLNRKKIGIIK